MIERALLGSGSKSSRIGSRQDELGDPEASLHDAGGSDWASNEQNDHGDKGVKGNEDVEAEKAEEEREGTQEAMATSGDGDAACLRWAMESVGQGFGVGGDQLAHRLLSSVVSTSGQPGGGFLRQMDVARWDARAVILGIKKLEECWMEHGWRGRLLRLMAPAPTTTHGAAICGTHAVRAFAGNLDKAAARDGRAKRNGRVQKDQQEQGGRRWQDGQVQKNGWVQRDQQEQGGTGGCGKSREMGVVGVGAESKTGGESSTGRMWLHALTKPPPLGRMAGILTLKDRRSDIPALHVGQENEGSSIPGAGTPYFRKWQHIGRVGGWGGSARGREEGSMMCTPVDVYQSPAPWKIAFYGQGGGAEVVMGKFGSVRFSAFFPERRT
ncbi:hypothetical protein GGX14DRAFT_393002 [Mycena pura]|uniref:Uncharacterized protein n=1 Tax=Mycena pura TaxID=153505 RepID=A0AAD6VLT1_9AGAR|nr:hypothetical protein GGX14DRAFT_393002 [Mycena pura]